MTRVVMPIAERDFDPTQVAVVWRALRDKGIEVRFATASAEEATSDRMLLTGEGLDVWGFIPGLKRVKLLGLLMRADRQARDLYERLLADPYFQTPSRFLNLKVEDYDGMVLPGGFRARGMTAFLEHAKLQRFVGEFFASGKPVGAIGHGVLLAARSCSPITGRSALYGRKTTALTWPLERRAFRISRFLGRVWDPNYFRTYPESGSMKSGALSIQSQVIAALQKPEDFQDAPFSIKSLILKRSGLFRDRPGYDRSAHVVIDDAYVSARWSGDTHTLAREFIELLTSYQKAGEITLPSRYFVANEEHHNEASRAHT